MLLCYFNGVPSGKNILSFLKPLIGTRTRVSFTTPKGLPYSVLLPGLPHY